MKRNLVTVREALMTRLKTKSRRNKREDDFHIALVLEGGGMRGVVSVGMASAFEQSGLLPAFDSIHGSSSGACGAAYFAAGQAEFGASIYYEDVNNTKFINLIRPLWGQSIMDNHFLVDHVMRTVKPLDVEKIISEPGFLNIVTTNCATGAEVQFDRFRDEDHFFQVLKATICLPIIAGRSISVGGLSLIDGGLVQQIAIRSAMRAGATHIISLMTRRSHELERVIRNGFQWDAAILRLSYGKHVEHLFKRQNHSINEVLRVARSGTVWESGRDVRIDSLSLRSDSVKIDRLTKDGSRLRQAFLQAKSLAFDYIEGRE